MPAMRMEPSFATLVAAPPAGAPNGDSTLAHNHLFHFEQAAFD